MSISAQSGPIEIRKNYWSGIKLHQNNYPLSHQESILLFSYDPNVLKLYKQGNNQYKTSSTISFFSWGLIGYTLGGLIRGSEPDGVIAFLGLAGLMIAIPVRNSGENKLKNAVDIYNTKLENEGFEEQEEYSISIQSRGSRVGLFINF